MNPNQRLWRIPAGAQFRWRHYDAESVLFDARSGLTHLLSAAAVDALALLENAPMASADLTDQVARRFEIDDPEAFRQQLGQVLGQLRELHLIEPV